MQEDVDLLYAQDLNRTGYLPDEPVIPVSSIRYELHSINAHTGSMNGPDLSVGIQIDDSDGPDIKYRYSVTNSGDEASGSFLVCIKLSENTRIDETDVTIEEKTLSLSAGQIYQTDWKWKDVGWVDAGTYYLAIWADAEMVVSESNEDNNRQYISSPQVIIEALPDLVITDCSVNEIQLNSRAIVVSYTVQNKGNQQAQLSWSNYTFVQLYLFSGETEYWYDNILYDVGLQAGESSTHEDEIFSSVKSIPQGDYNLRLIVDGGANKITESRENNNDAVVNDPIIRIPEPYPDLQWEGSYEATYYLDEIIPGTYPLKLCNYGWSGISDPFTYNVLLSSDQASSQDDHVIVNPTWDQGLEACGSMEADYHYSTKNIPAGGYYIISEADPGNDITELSETNNKITSEKIEIVHLNLTCPNGGEVWIKGNPYMVQWTTDGTVSNVCIALFKEDEGIRLFACPTPNTGSFQVIPDAGLEDGDMFRIRIREGNKPQRTEDYSDSFFTIQTTAPSNPKPDLIVQSVEVLDSEGPEIRFKGEIKNQGDASAGQSTAKFYLSSDQQISNSDYFIHSWPLTGSMSAGSSQHSGEVTTVISGVPAGEYFLGLIADEQQQVSESNEGNNTGYAGSPKVAIPQSQGPHWADIDGDGDVDAVDIQLVAACWNTQAGDAGYSAACDVDNDGDVDAVDIQLVAGWWNRI